MEIDSLPPIVHAPPASKTRSGKASASSSDGESQVRDAQNQYTDRVNQVQQQIQTVSRDGETQVNAMKQEYANEIETESSREETQLEAERLKGYQRLRDLQRAQAAELARVQREGDDRLAQAHEYYRNTEYNSGREQTEKLRDVAVQNQNRLDFERKSGALMGEQVKKEQQSTLERLRSQRDTQVAAGEKESADFIEQRREMNEQSIAQNNKNAEAKYAATVSSTQEALGKVETNAARQLKNAQLSNSRSLSAYGSTREDPFYQPVTTDSTFHDAGDHYVLTASVPAHEQEHVNVTVQGNQIVLSGYRRNEEKIDLGKGHAMGTNSYQSFSESYPFYHPIEAAQISKEFDGDTLTVTIPKKSMVTAYQPYKPKPSRMVAERPHYPSNLPHTDEVDVNGNPIKIKT